MPAPKKSPTIESIPAPQKPDRGAFLDPQSDKVLRRYFLDVHDWHGYIKFLGLPALIETSRDVPLRNLYVEPRFAAQHLTPESFDNTGRLPETVAALEALKEHQRLVLLGDPGSGKSTLVNWLAECLTFPLETPVTSALGPLVPLPLILRELGIDASITWDSLLEKFLARPVAQSLKENPQTLETLLQSGQAFVMLDGIDEIASIEVRQALRKAVYDGFRRYPLAQWLLTSRVVGYDEVNFNQLQVDFSPNSGSGGSAGFVQGTALLRYAAPFNDSQVEQFASNWYSQHDSNPHLAKTDAVEFLKAVKDAPDTRRLARIPNLLTLMALIYRIEAELPHGRAVLYRKISEAYLNSIDSFRKLPMSVNFTLSDKERWLAAVAFQMQLRRHETQKLNKEWERGFITARLEIPGEILVPGDKVIKWLAEAMRPKVGNEAEKTAAALLDYIGRRSGLLLPRGENQFAFLHLTFQEYYAGLFIKETIMSRVWLKNNDFQQTDTSETSLPRLRDYANSPVWQETFLLLFESLSDEGEWPDDLLRLLFENDFEANNPQPLKQKFMWGNVPYYSPKDDQTQMVTLLSLISVDPHSGLSADLRPILWRVCWQWEIDRQQQTTGDHSVRENLVARALLTPIACLSQVVQQLVEVASAASLRHMWLCGCVGLSDVSALAALINLQFLDLSGTSMSDVSVLAALTHLKSLRLVGTPVSDVSALAALINLQVLNLSGTPVSDVSALVALPNLQVLSMSENRKGKVSGVELLQDKIHWV